jgi:hypothetical protein
MAWKTALIFLFGIILFGCETLRTLPLCSIDWDNQVSHCAEGDKKYKKQLPELDEWIATDEASWRKIGDKLQECERRKP